MDDGMLSRTTGRQDGRMEGRKEGRTSRKEGHQRKMEKLLKGRKDAKEDY
jgi:hypothetical protein